MESAPEHRFHQRPKTGSLDSEKLSYLTSTLSSDPNNWFRTEESQLVYKPERVSYLEVHQSQSSDARLTLAKGTLKPEEVESWLSNSKTRASASISSLRILFGECHQLSGINITSSQYLQIPFSKHKFERVIESMRIQPQYVWALEDAAGQVSKFRGPRPGVWSCIFKLGLHATGFYTMSMSYDAVAHSTSVLLLTQTHFHDRDMIVAMLHWETYKALISQPMLVPFLVCTSISAIHASKIHLSIATLNAIEEEMGQHTYINRYKGNPLEVDFVATTTTLNSNTARLAINEAKLKSLISALCLIHEYNAIDHTDHPLLQRQAEVLWDFVQHLKDYCENLLLRNDAEQKRTASQLAVVYNFMAQKDNLLNIALAKDSRAIAASSKQDSSAMKTIAVVTMVFLPGTYVAALFAVPFFDWNAPNGSSILNGRFWYYWAVTIPLTALVLIFWLLFVPLYKLLKQHAHKKVENDDPSKRSGMSLGILAKQQKDGMRHRKMHPPLAPSRPGRVSTIRQS